MAFLDEAIRDEEFFFKLFIYGPSQSRKTLWAAKAAEAGYNVTIFDGDGNSAILRNIKPEYRRNIVLVNAIDELSRPVFWPFLVRVFKGSKFAWDVRSKDFRASPQACNPEHAHVVIDPSKVTKNDVWIIDSYTAAANSVRWNNAILHQIDLANVEKLDWDIYGPDSVSLNWFLPLIKALKCHVICIGHVNDYEKKDDKGKTILRRKLPISSSVAHGMNIAKYFTDMYRFYLTGGYTRIDTKADEFSEGGSRFIPPSIYAFEDGPIRLQFADMLRLGGITAPGLNGWASEAVKIFPPGVTPDIPGQPTLGTKIDVTKSFSINTGTQKPPAPSSLGGLAGVLAKKAAEGSTPK